MPWSISTLLCGIAPTRIGSSRNSTVATTCIPITRATKRWLIPSTFRCSPPESRKRSSRFHAPDSDRRGIMTKTVLAALLVLTSLAYGQSRQSEAEHWIATWAAAPQLPTPPGQARAGAFSGAFNNQTVRMIVHTSIGGHRVRVALSNAFGAAPLTIGAAHVALRVKDSAIAPNSDRALLFNGKPSCSIPVGAFLISDPVDLDVPKLSDLAVSV